jgi:hypothetical protein
MSGLAESKPMVNRVAIQSVPSSWAAADWDSKAPGVYPGSARRARKLLKVHRSALLAHGALGRVGRGIVIFGDGYSRWLAEHVRNVAGYQCPANAHRERAAAAVATSSESTAA